MIEKLVVNNATWFEPTFDVLVFLYLLLFSRYLW